MENSGWEVGESRWGGGWNSKCIWPLVCVAIVTLASHLRCTCGCEAVIRSIAALCHPVKKRHAHHVSVHTLQQALIHFWWPHSRLVHRYLDIFLQPGDHKVGRVMGVTDEEGVETWRVVKNFCGSTSETLLDFCRCVFMRVGGWLFCLVFDRKQQWAVS